MNVLGYIIFAVFFMVALKVVPMYLEDSLGTTILQFSIAVVGAVLAHYVHKIADKQKVD